MRIAQIAPLHEAVPPKLYGGTERVVSFLTEELVEMGHDVTLFASGDSITSAKVQSIWPRALRLDPAIRDPIAPHMLLMEAVRRQAEEFDVLHFHMDYWSFSLFGRQRTPFVTTLHGRLDLPELQPVFNTFSNVPVVSISDSQRRPLPQANFVDTVLHGLPKNLLTPVGNPGGYLAFLGRIAPEKCPDRAIRIAQETGLPIKLAAKVDVADKLYFEKNIRHLLDQPGVEMIGEILGSGKARVPVWRRGTPHADRLARAVRPGDDRGDGVRHTGDRLQPRFGAGDCGGRGHRLHRRRYGGCGCRSRRSCRRLTALGCAAASRSVSPRAAWRRITWRSTAAWLARTGRSCVQSGDRSG